MALGHGGDVLYTAGGDGVVRAWDCARDMRSSVQSYTAVEVLRGPLFAVSALLSQSRPRPRLLSAGMDNVMYEWDLSQHTAFTPQGRVRVATRVFKGHEGVVNAMATWGTRTLLTGGGDGTLRVWDMDAVHDEDTLRRTFHMSDKASVAVRSLLVMDDSRVITGTADGLMRMWLKVDEQHLGGATASGAA
mmetsp:Transcript_29247/g.85759  ORF Transcript_29247/g.85759 Transcript_29247/m.85759 type:complete len:190 (+) Transcript_29247:3-572(+)